MKKKTDPTSLADALSSYFRQAGLTKRVQQAGIIEKWAELVGPQIAAVTAPESVTPMECSGCGWQRPPGPTS